MNLAKQIESACVLEATARKPGNVHPWAAFDDLCYADFVQAARAVAEPISKASDVGIGQAILDAVIATRSVTETNVNLGIILLLVPLAAVPLENSLAVGIESILARTTIEDAEKAYAAIRMAQPAGMGKVSDHDIAGRPALALRAAMQLAAERDLIAVQYVNGFQQVLKSRQQFTELFLQSNDWETAIIQLQLWMMMQWPDTLIARKCGRETAKQASIRAKQVIDEMGEEHIIDSPALKEFDRWLREDGHRRNPGTTADLIAATLFATFRDGCLAIPELNMHST